jgi:quercetin dioxygenase-like cupin family protein
MAGPAPPDTSVPDRSESIQRPDQAAWFALDPGLVLRPLVGAHNGARNLFTGLLTVEPGAQSSPAKRPVGEALTQLAGTVTVEVEGRRYVLSPLDSIFIPGGVARKLANPSNSPAELHVAVATDSPAQSPVSVTFPESDQPVESTGRDGGEHLTRASAAERFELAPGAMFQDYFNARLGGRGICGGYGLFSPGSRLPCHRHDFDESITIIQGRATCVVEGRRYELSDNATALVPRGRSHYFINQSEEPMAMIWVYAGDMPDRIVVDETFCHPPGGGH